MGMLVWIFPAIIFLAAGDRDAKRLRRIFGRTISSTSTPIRNTSLVERGKTNATSALPGGWERGNRNVVVTSKLADRHFKAFNTFLNHHNGRETSAMKSAITQAQQELKTNNNEYVINKLTLKDRMISLSHLASAFIIICINSDKKHHTNDYQGFVQAGGAIDTALDNFAMAPLRLGSAFSQDFFIAYDKMHFAQHLASLFGWGLRTQNMDDGVEGMEQKRKAQETLVADREKQREDMEKTKTPELTSKDKADNLLYHVRHQTNQEVVEKLWVKFREYVAALETELASFPETHICCTDGSCPERDGGGALYGKDQCPDLEGFYVSLTKFDSAYDKLMNPGNSAAKVGETSTRNKAMNYLLELITRCNKGIQTEYTYPYDPDAWILMKKFCGGSVDSSSPENQEHLQAKCETCGWNTQTDVSDAETNVRAGFPVPEEMSKEEKQKYQAEILAMFNAQHTISYAIQLSVRDLKTEVLFSDQIGKLLNWRNN